MKDFFAEKGYNIFPSVLTKERVQEVRDICLRLVEKHQLLTLTPTQFLSEEKVCSVLFEPAVTEALKTIFSPNYVMYPNFTVRQSLYIPWHTDVSFLPKQCRYDGGPTNFLQCAVYLQDNTPETGGGVNVLPGSHLRRHGESPDMGESNEGLPLYSSAGDFIVWDSRLMHSSTKPTTNIREKKLAIQWTVSRTKELSSYFISYLISRAQEKLHVSDYVGERPIEYFKDMPSVKYPNSFPSEILSMMNKNSIEFVEINKQEDRL